MFLRCPECKTRYEISATSIPEGGARVRCPRCRTVFGVARPASPRPLSESDTDLGGLEDESAVAELQDNPSELSEAVPLAGDAVVNAAPHRSQANGYLAPLDVDELGDPPNAEADAATTPTEAPGPGERTGPDVEPEPAGIRRPRPPGAGGRPMPAAAHAVVAGAPVEAVVARRIARALVSEVLLERRELRNAALRDGLLLARLGPAILEAWDRYRERVGAPIADGTRFFHEAVNDILGEGQALL